MLRDYEVIQGLVGKEEIVLFFSLGWMVREMVQ